MDKFPKNVIDCTIKLVFSEGDDIIRNIEIPYDDYLFFETEEERMNFINDYYIIPERAKVYLEVYPELYPENTNRRHNIEKLINKEFFDDDVYTKKIIESLFN